MTLELHGVGTLGDVVASGGGTWTYDYHGTTLPEGIYAFRAKASLNGVSSPWSSPDFLATIDRTAPTVTADVMDQSPITSLGPRVLVTARDLIGVAANATVTLDVDLDNNNNFSGGGETGYTTGTLTDGKAIIKLPDLPATGTYKVRARALDLAGNEGTSTNATFTVTVVNSPGVPTGTPVSIDPVQGEWLYQLGDVTAVHGLDLDTSPGTDSSGSEALVYHSSTVNQKPFVQVNLTLDNQTTLPASIDMRLTFNGSAAATVTYSTSGLSPGDPVTATLQGPNTITTTGRYDWSVVVTLAGGSPQTISGYTFIDARDSSDFGAGWGIAGEGRLYAVSASGGDPAGVFMVYGAGGWRFFQDAGGGTYTSPAGDNGTLTLSGGTYTYALADGEEWTFDSGGKLAQWTSEDGYETLQSRYDVSNRLNGLTATDGTLATITYNTNQVLIQTSNSRTVTLTLATNDLTQITNPDGGAHTFTYASHRMTGETFGLLHNEWDYDSSGAVGTMTWGSTSFGGVSNPSRTILAPAVTQGVSALTAGTLWASSASPDGHVSNVALDGSAKPTQRLAADGGWSQTGYTNALPTSFTDEIGRTTTQGRDAQGFVTQTLNADSTTRSAAYRGGDHALTTATNERGKVTLNDYDTDGHLTGRTDAEGNQTTITWNSGLPETEVDARLNTTTYQYDMYRRPSVTINPDGGRTTVTYDANGNEYTVTAPDLSVTTMVHDVMGRLTSEVDAEGDTTTQTWDVSGLQLSRTDSLGHLASMIYDDYGKGLLVKTVEAVGTNATSTSLSLYNDSGQQIGTRNANGWWSDATLDAVGRAIGSTDALGNRTKTVTDLAGQVIATRDQVGNWTLSSPDAMGRVTQSTDGVGNVTGTTFDEDGNPTERTDAGGKKVTMVYDDVDRMTVEIDQRGKSATTVYDEVSNVISRIDRNLVENDYEYDKQNRQTTMTLAVGTSVQKTELVNFDSVGNALSRQDGEGALWSSTFDKVGRALTNTDPNSHTSTVGYNTAGNATMTLDALGKETDYGYDALNRQVTVTDPLNHTTTTVLDGNGANVATIDPLGNTTVNVQDAAGRAIGTISPKGAFNQTVRDAAGNVIDVIDAMGNDTHYLFDRNNREIVRIDPNGFRTTTGYDARGRATMVLDRNGREMDYGYDDANRKISETWKTDMGTVVNQVTITYDDNSNRLTIADSTGTITNSVDELNRVKTTTDVFGVGLTYTYDGADRVTKRQDSLGGVMTSVFDPAGQLTSRRFSGTGGSGTVVRVDFGYNNRGDQTSIARYSDLAGTTPVGTSIYAIDDAHRLTGITNKDGSGVTLSYYNYGYDNADRVTSETRSSAVGTVTFSGTNNFGYDQDSQLISDASNTYNFDLNGNRTSVGTVAYATGADNRMTSDGTFSYTYDNEGNQLTKSKGPGQEKWYYTWDNRNRLTNVRKTSDGTTDVMLATYTYDADDRLVKRTAWTLAGGTQAEQRYTYDGYQVIADLDNSNVITARYHYGNKADQLVARTVVGGGNAGPAYYLTDRQGSIRDIVTFASQTVADHNEFTGFGVKTESNPGVGDGFGYTAKRLDGDTGEQYNIHRWYDAATGKWVSQDPIGFAAGPSNLFGYVSNAATNMLDPAGLAETDDRVTPFTTGLVDVQDKLNDHVNSVIRDARAKYPAGTPNAVKKICRYVYDELGENKAGSGVTVAGVELAQWSKIECWIKDNLDPKKGEYYWYSYAGSRYGTNPVGRWANRGGPFALYRQDTADHMIAPTINVGGVLMGGDKWGHFFQQGYWIFAEGLTNAEARDFSLWTEGAPEWYAGKNYYEWDKWDRLYPIKFHKSKYSGGVFHGIFGTASTGVISYADINANLAGNAFYKDLAANPYGYVFNVRRATLRSFNEQNVPNSYIKITPNDTNLPAPGTPSR